MNTYGLVGYPLGHSFSKKYFEEKFISENINAQFLNFEIDNINKFHDIIRKTDDLKGLSVTIPYKETIIPFLDELSEEAKIIGAVNSIKVSHTTEGIFTKGYNTDMYGFQSSLLEFIGDNRSNALILGTGGAAKAVEFALIKLKIKYKIVSRSPKSDQISYDDIEDLINDYKIIINTTPLGMFPKIETYPQLPYNKLDKSYFLFDLTYNPVVTTFMRKGQAQGANVKNGLDMLHAQALKSWTIWNNS